MEKVVFVCPKCRKPLTREGNSYYCESAHCFDVAKEGYVNLLTADMKHSKEPGDNADMVRARYDFLEGGYYLPLANRIAALLKKYCAPNARVLDAGSGSGHYDRVIEKHLPEADIVGVDISKEAVRLAAKHSANVRYAVAGVYDLPFEDSTFDAVLNVFSPFAFEEYARVLKDDGLLVSVYPAPLHLWELKKHLYDEATFENDKKVDSPLFCEVEQSIESAKITVIGEDVKNLLKMTPYYYTSAKEKLDEVERLTELETHVAFCVSAFEKV